MIMELEKSNDSQEQNRELLGSSRAIPSDNDQPKGFSDSP